MSVYDFIIHRASACSLQTNMALLVIILHDELIREKGPCSSQPHVACSVLYLYCRCGINQELCQLAPPPPQWVVIFATVGKRGQQNVCIKIKSKHCRLLLFFFFPTNASPDCAMFESVMSEAQSCLPVEANNFLSQRNGIFAFIQVDKFSKTQLPLLLSVASSTVQN